MKHRYDQIRVVASPDGMFILDAKGAKIHVFAVNIALRAGQPPVMQLNMLAQPFDVAGQATFMAVDPVSGEPKPVKRIEFWDDTAHDFPKVELPVGHGVAMQPPPGGPPAASDPAGAKPITPSVAGQGGNGRDEQPPTEEGSNVVA